MSDTVSPSSRSAKKREIAIPRELEPLDPQLQWTQPGGGVIVHLELFWGRIRRAWLKTFRRGYLRRMEQTRQGESNAAPIEILDPRDLKFYRNQPGYWWKREDDPFQWREKIPFARWGLAELFVFSLICFGGAGICCVLAGGEGLSPPGRWAGHLSATALTVIGILIVWFFRDPPRRVPQETGAVLAPADGKVVEIRELDHHDFVGGPAVQIGIFLSIFNVHINRLPVSGRVIGVEYTPGKYLNALRPESARENERVEIRMEQHGEPHRGIVIRQITGAIARRIVCDLKPGDEGERGDKLGMIKLGSRTELVIPQEEGLQVIARLGDKIKAGATILARYSGDAS
jgi:phosphatidylserine decarboxylase